MSRDGLPPLTPHAARYHAEHPALLAGVISARLDRGATALLLCPLRDARLLPALTAAAELRGLVVTSHEATTVEQMLSKDAALSSYEAGTAVIRLCWREDA